MKARILDQHIKVHGPLSDSKAALALFPTNGKKGHDLVVLAGLAQVSLTDDTKGLLIRLTTYVRWAGRYPIPKEPGEAGFRRTTRQNDLLDVKTFLDGL